MYYIIVRVPVPGLPVIPVTLIGLIIYYSTASALDRLLASLVAGETGLLFPAGNF